MKEETGYFSSFDGTKLFYRAWEQDTQNVLIIFHGIGEHSGRYRETIDSLSELPFSFFIYDMRGHGHSEGERVYINAFDDLIKDAYSFKKFIETRRSQRARNFILMGQSLGGLVATAVALENQKDWRVLILFSPFFSVGHSHELLFVLAKFLNVLCPKKIWRNPIKPMFLTHDQEEIKRYKRDPLVQRRITGHMAYEMFKGCARVRSHAKQLSLPLLVLAGGDDHIVSTREVGRFFDQASSSEKQIEIFPKCYHELLHEREREIALTIVKKYLLKLGLH